MDKYTEKTKQWLETSYSGCDTRGIYRAHDPIYGFRKGPSKRNVTNRYIRTYQTIKALSYIDFRTLLDVGAAEGYKANIVRRLFGASVECCDISEEACKRTKDIFGIKATCADIHSLPFKNNSFDVVLCLQTIEHVSDFQKAMAELLRVARNAVLISVPHESPAYVRKTAEKGAPHRHLHSFDLKSFDALSKDGYMISANKILGPKLLQALYILLDARPIVDEDIGNYPKSLIALYNALVPFAKNLFGKKTAACFVKFDDFICRFSPFYSGILFVIAKPRNIFKIPPYSKISIDKIMDIEVPLHRIRPF